MNVEVFAYNHSFNDTIYLDPGSASPGGSGKNPEDPALNIPERCLPFEHFFRFEGSPRFYWYIW